MSHPRDIKQRTDENSLNIFERINTQSKNALSSLNINPATSAEKLCIKHYERSSADKNFDNPDEIRPPIVIYNTFSYIRDCILD